jgi:hypothetical protein
MIKTILCIFLAVFVVSFGALEAKAFEPNDTVLSYFQALQQGDINTIKNTITGEMYKNNKVILEQNENYPEYLRKAYQGAEFQIIDSTINNNEAEVKAKVNFPDRQNEFVLLLIKDDLGNWKIFKEISDQ